MSRAGSQGANRKAPADAVLGAFRYRHRRAGTEFKLSRPGPRFVVSDAGEERASEACLREDLDALTARRLLDAAFARCPTCPRNSGRTADVAAANCACSI